MKLFDIQKLLKINFKTPVYTLYGFLLIYIAIQVSIPKVVLHENKALLTKVDSLEKIAIRLEKEQSQEQNRDSLYYKKLDSINIRLELAKKASLEVRNYYREELTKARRFTPTQVDSFFKKRYGF